MSQSHHAPPVAAGGRERTAAYFARLSRTYGDGELYGRRRAAVVQALREEVQSARALLDLGCGNGRYLAEFAAKADAAVRLVGADASVEMLREARGRLAARVVLARADAGALPFRSARFDLIFASHVLPFVADLRVAVSDAARCLRPGGALVATVGGGGALRAALAPLMTRVQWERFAQAIFGPRFEARAERLSMERHRDAFIAAGLACEAREAAFTVAWPDVAEWVRVRWLPVVGAREGAVAKRTLARLSKEHSTREFQLAESLLIGRKRG